MESFYNDLFKRSTQLGYQETEPLKKNSCVPQEPTKAMNVVNAM